ncbi:MAG: hypothetical protein ACI3VB_05480 [Oscillospiraceae bacterium]
MELVAEIIIAAAVCAAVAAVIWSVRGMLLTPVIRREDVDVFAVIRARGEAAGLEQTVRGLLWLGDSGKAEMGLIIVDDGMTQEAHRRAEMLAEQSGGAVCPPERLIHKTEELRWRNTDS